MYIYVQIDCSCHPCPFLRSGRSHGPDGNGLWHVSAAPAAADDATADATAATDAAAADAATSVKYSHICIYIYIHM